MVRRVKESVSNSIYDTLKSCAKRNKIDQYFEFNDHRSKIKCIINDNVFLPMGTYESVGKTGPSKSIANPTDALIDEMDELTESEFTKLVFSIRGSDDMEVIGVFNTNIVDEEHWIFKRFFPPVETFERKDGKHTYVKSKRNNVTILHTTYLMNPYCNQQTRDDFEQERINNPDNYEIEGLGLIKAIKMSNLALDEFDRRKHIKDDIEFNPDALTYFSWDFNKLPHHTVGCWQFGGFDKANNEYKWNLIKEFCLENHSITKTQKEINKWLKRMKYQPQKVVIVCDYSGNTKRDHDAKSSVNRIKSELSIGGFKVVDRTIVNPPVITSLNFLNDIFAGAVKVSTANSSYGGAAIKIQIHPECKFYIADFEKTKTDKEGKILKITKRDSFVEDGITVNRTYQVRGHAVDNSRYLFTSVFSFEYQHNKSARA